MTVEEELTTDKTAETVQMSDRMENSEIHSNASEKKADVEVEENKPEPTGEPETSVTEEVALHNLSRRNHLPNPPHSG